MTSSSNDFIAGCMAGVAQVLVGQPFDIVKVRLQAGAQGLYTSAWDCFSKIVKYEGGPMSLWKGSLPPLLGVGAVVSIQFGVNEKTKQLAKKLTGRSELLLPHLFGCGMVAGTANTVVSAPVEHTRIRMQIQGTSSVSAVQCVKSIVQGYGLKGLYRGVFPTLWRDSISMGIYFSMYEWVTRSLLAPHQTKADLTMAGVAFAGGLAGVTLWFATFPIDMIKTKIQTDSLQNPAYKSMKDCFQKVYQANGLRGLYKGLAPCLFRAVPANSVTFIAFEAVSKLLTSKTDIMKKYKLL